MTAETSIDAEVALLACTSLALPRETTLQPLGPTAWATLRERAAGAGLRPRDLAALTASELAARLDIEPERSARVAGLLARRGQLAMELERLSRLGIWWTTVGGDGYPGLLVERLREQAPPVLFGLGERSLLEADGLAVVGSRDADARSLEIARGAGERAARQGWSLVSGAARGVDAEAMRGAFDQGGVVVGVPADGLERHLRDATVRAAAAEGRLAYISPYRPDTAFSVGMAMGRNKLIYCLARVALVVHATAGGGGTWAGAVEGIEHGWVPVHVIAGDGAPEGNDELVKRGALPIEGEALADLGALRTASSGAGGAIDADGPVQAVLGL